MKAKALFCAMGMLVSLSAAATPVMSLPGGPIFFKFTGREQIAINGASTGTAFGDSSEINWGVFTVDTMSKGSVDIPHQQISPTGAPIFVNQLSGAQITGMFYGVDGHAANPTDPFPASGGYLDLYWRDNSVLPVTDVSTSNVAGLRTALNQATGYTQGTLLAHLKFTPGADTTDNTVTISGSVLPTGSGFTGEADSFANVDTSAGGAWAVQLATQYYSTVFGSADLKFKNSYNALTTWNDATNANILGAKLDDPGQAFAVPEPGVMSLMGLAMLGMGVVRRRRKA